MGHVASLVCNSGVIYGGVQPPRLWRSNGKRRSFVNVVCFSADIKHSISIIPLNKNSNISVQSFPNCTNKECNKKGLYYKLHFSQEKQNPVQKYKYKHFLQIVIGHTLEKTFLFIYYLFTFCTKLFRCPLYHFKKLMNKCTTVVVSKKSKRK